MNIILPCYLITPCIYSLTPSVPEDPSLHCYCCCFFPYCSSPSQSSWFALYLNPTNEYAQKSISYQLSPWNSYLGPLNSYQGHIVQQHIFGCQQGMKMSHSYLKLSLYGSIILITLMVPITAAMYILESSYRYMCYISSCLMLSFPCVSSTVTGPDPGTVARNVFGIPALSKYISFIQCTCHSEC